MTDQHKGVRSGSAYIRGLYHRTRGGILTLSYGEGRCQDHPRQYAMDWGPGEPEQTVERYEQLLSALEEAKPDSETYNTYLRPFPDHGMDEALLEQIWTKQDLQEPLTRQEQALAERYAQWYRRQALERMPCRRCEPVGLINRARRYGTLVRLGAPEEITEAEARRLALELVLYRCCRDTAAAAM